MGKFEDCFDDKWNKLMLIYMVQDFMFSVKEEPSIQDFLNKYYLDNNYLKKTYDSILASDSYRVEKYIEDNKNIISQCDIEKLRNSANNNLVVNAIKEYAKYTRYLNMNLNVGDMFMETLKDENGNDYADVFILQTENGLVYRSSTNNSRIFMCNIAFKTECDKTQTFFVKLEQEFVIEDGKVCGLCPKESWAMIDGKFVSIEQIDESALYDCIELVFKNEISKSEKRYSNESKNREICDMNL